MQVQRVAQPIFTEGEARRVFKEAGLKLRVIHLHEGNSHPRIGPNASVRYVTVAFVYPEGGNRPIAEGYAMCSCKDNPSRKIGRAIAVGRCFKDYWLRTISDPEHK
jgi:hypothetical protein